MPLFCRFSPHFFSFSWILVTRILHHWKGMASSLIFWGFGNQNHHPTPPKRDRISTFQDIWFTRKPPEFAGTISGTKSGYRKWREQYLTALYQSSVLLFGWSLTDWRTCPEKRQPSSRQTRQPKTWVNEANNKWRRQLTNEMTTWCGMTEKRGQCYPTTAPQQEHGQREKMRNKTSDETTHSDMKQMTWKMKTDGKWRGKQ